MKKALYLLIVLLICFSFAGCKKEEQPYKEVFDAGNFDSCCDYKDYTFTEKYIENDERGVLTHYEEYTKLDKDEFDKVRDSVYENETRKLENGLTTGDWERLSEDTKKIGKDIVDYSGNVEVFSKTGNIIYMDIDYGEYDKRIILDNNNRILYLYLELNNK